MILTIALGIVLAFLIMFIGPWVIGAIALLIGLLISCIYDDFVWIKLKLFKGGK